MAAVPTSARPLPRRRSIHWGENAWATLKYAGALVVLLVLLLPIYAVITSSLKNDRDIFVHPPTILTFQPTLANYQQTLTSLDFLLFARNSLLVACTVTVLTLGVSCLAAHALARYEFPGAKLIALAILSARLVPGVAMIMPYYVIFRWYHLNGTLQGLIVGYTGFFLPFASWLMYGFFLEIPSDVEDSGRIDGCSDFGVFWRIVLPLTRPGLAATAILVFLGAWNEFFFALVMTGRDTRTLPVYLATFISERTIFWGALFTVAALMIVPCFILVLSVQKSLVRGLTAGAVKG